MARVGRLAGAILAETEGTYFLVGYTKEPCDWERAGFAPPEEPAPGTRRPYVKLENRREVAIGEPYLAIPVEGEALAVLLARCFLIERNGSVSDRLWRLVTNPHAALEPKATSSIDARWLGETPAPVWGVVRDTVLRCT